MIERDVMINVTKAARGFIVTNPPRGDYMGLGTARAYTTAGSLAGAVRAWAETGEFREEEAEPPATFKQTGCPSCGDKDFLVLPIDDPAAWSSCAKCGFSFKRPEPEPPAPSFIESQIVSVLTQANLDQSKRIEGLIRLNKTFNAGLQELSDRNDVLRLQNEGLKVENADLTKKFNGLVRINAQLDVELQALSGRYDDLKVQNDSMAGKLFTPRFTSPHP